MILIRYQFIDKLLTCNIKLNIASE